MNNSPESQRPEGIPTQEWGFKRGDVVAVPRSIYAEDGAKTGVTAEEDWSIISLPRTGADGNVSFTVLSPDESLMKTVSLEDLQRLNTFAPEIEKPPRDFTVGDEVLVYRNLKDAKGQTLGKVTEGGWKIENIAIDHNGVEVATVVKYEAGQVLVKKYSVERLREIGNR